MKPLDKWRFAETLAADADLSPLELRVGVRLASLYNGKRGCAWPSYQRLAEELKAPRRSIIRAVKLLAGRGYVRIGRGGGRGRANDYRIVLEWEGCPFGKARKKRVTPASPFTENGDTSVTRNGVTSVTPSYLLNQRRKKNPVPLNRGVVAKAADAPPIPDPLNPGRSLRLLSAYRKNGGDRFDARLKDKWIWWLGETEEEHRTSNPELAGWAHRLREELETEEDEGHG